jgi:hypothetical protein
MENPQAQMPQGQPGMEQGQAPQQGGQDQQMQQLMQAVQQMIQQGAQPADVAAELLGQQVPPEVIMQVFVQMGLPEQDAQMAIQEAMQGGQQPQGQGGQEMEGSQEEEDDDENENENEQEGAPMMPPGMEGQAPMAFGGQPRRMLRRRAEGGGMDPQQELQAVMEQIQGMMDQGADARQVMAQIEAAAQQGQISPEVATQVMEQLGGMQQAENPQGSDVAMTEGSQDPQMMDPNVATPEAPMMRFGGNLKKLMKKAYGGDAIPPTLDSKNYAQERANMFVTSVKNNAFKSTLDEEFPSLTGNQMAYGGNIPKAANGISMKDGKLTIDPTQYKTEAEYKAAVYDWNTNAANKDNQVTTELFTANKWAEQPDQNASYKYDPNTKQYVKQAPTQQPVQPQVQPGSPYVVSQGAINPVAYQDPRGNSLYDNLYMSANPWARMIAGSGNRIVDPRITGSNLPGGMNANQFLGAIGGVDKLTSGMTGTVGNQTWRLGEAEKFKEGSIWKGNRRKGVRYKIDWGDAAAFNTPAGTPAGPQNNPLEGNSTPMGPQGQIIDPAILPGANLKPVLDAQGNQFISDGSNMMWNTGNMPTMPASYQSPVNNTAPTTTTPVATTPTVTSTANSNPITVANQNLVTPGQSNVQQPAAEVNAEDNARANMTVTNATDQGIRGVDDQGNLVSQDYKDNKWDRRENRQENRQARQDKREILRENRQGSRAVQNMLNEEAAKTQLPPERMQEAFQQYQELQPQAYGGNINPQDLANAVALINRAFGGMIPRAVDGMDLGSEDANGNKIPDYLEAANLPTSPNQGYVEESAGKKFNVDWNAAADVYATSGAKFANFMNRVGSYQGNQERELAKRSALNRPSDTYDTMEQGVYDQWGNFKPNDLNNQVLNPTDTYRLNQKQIYAYGGRLYEIGGEVELDDNELQQLSAAGFKISRA